MRHTKHYTKIPILLLGLIFAISLSFMSISSISSFAEDSPVYLEETNRPILQYDTIEIYIWPVVERLSVDSFSLSPNMQFRIYFAGNDTDRSVVQMQPQSEGIYNLTVSFETNKTWNYTVGVYTDTPSFYSEYSNVTPRDFETFIVFFTRTIKGPSGNSTLTFVLDSHSRGPSPFFEFFFPQSINAVFFVAITLILGYVDAFYMFDTYFKNKKEGVSKKRWTFAAILLVGSFFVIYKVYLVTTFSSPWSV